MTSADRRLTPRRTPRQVRAELTRERILAAAAHVFARHGYAAGTTNRIAEQARVSIGSLYQYFPNKDAILAELLLRHIGQDPWPAAGPDLAPGTLKETVRGLVRDATDRHRHDPRLLRIMIEETPVSSTMSEAIDRHRTARERRVREVLARHPDVRVQDLDVAAQLVVGTVEMNVHMTLATPNAVSGNRLEGELVDMITRYLRGDLASGHRA
ncbi:TetR/AcrR family transcriptional regulator [Streptomyces sp. NPDC093252]|uniref:TetR/AcrR family transcriptional regulator n=1 Tax=Streptomyces sp. NPDC093252 TaxID=3154980 RepID=UPI00342B3E34